MIRSLDRSVGTILKAVKDAGIDDNTIIIFTSDNGGANYIGLPQINKPFRGWKATFFEGGTHVPFMMRWPGHIAPGARYDAPISHFDIYATASAAGGVALPTDRTVDGVDVLPFVAGTRAGVPHQALFWRSGSYRVVREGDWKLQSVGNPRLDLLYDLKTDPTERTNVAAAHPEVVAAMNARLKAHDAEQMPPAWGSLISSPIPIDRPLGVPPKPGEAFIYWDN
jgi:arylsulfatase A-like enzyme